MPSQIQVHKAIKEKLKIKAVKEIEFNVVVQAQQASVSMLQRRFRIGYNRAARIIDMMEERQIIGPADGSRPRQVLISEADLQNMKESTEDLER